MICPVNVSLVSNIYGTVQIVFLRVCLQSKTSILYGSPLFLLIIRLFDNSTIGNEYGSLVLFLTLAGIRLMLTKNLKLK